MFIYLDGENNPFTRKKRRSTTDVRSASISQCEEDRGVDWTGLFLISVSQKKAKAKSLS